MPYGPRPSRLLTEISTGTELAPTPLLPSEFESLNAGIGTRPSAPPACPTTPAVQDSSQGDDAGRLAAYAVQQGNERPLKSLNE